MAAPDVFGVLMITATTGRGPRPSLPNLCQWLRRCANDNNRLAGAAEGVRSTLGKHTQNPQVAAPAREDLAQLHSVPTVAPLGTPH